MTPVRPTPKRISRQDRRGTCPSGIPRVRSSVGNSPSRITVLHCALDRRGRLKLRRGAVLVCVLVCLLCVSALVANMMRSIIRVQQQLKLEQASRQVELLLDAGRTRAAYRLANDAAYLGESWQPQPGSLASDRAAAAVTIVVEPAVDGQTYLVQVTAEYPDVSPHSVRRSQRFVVSAVP